MDYTKEEIEGFLSTDYIGCSAITPSYCLYLIEMYSRGNDAYLPEQDHIQSALDDNFSTRFEEETKDVEYEDLVVVDQELVFFWAGFHPATPFIVEDSKLTQEELDILIEAMSEVVENESSDGLDESSSLPDHLKKYLKLFAIGRTEFDTWDCSGRHFQSYFEETTYC